MNQDSVVYEVERPPPRGFTASPARLPDADVIVVGAGPTGLTLACELLRLGVSCLVLDRSAAPQASSRATDVHSRTLELLDRLGAAKPLVARGRTVHAFNAFAGGRVVSRLDFEALKSPFPFTVAVPQRDTEEILTGRLVAEGGAILRGAEVVSLAARPAGADLTIAKDGRTERLRCRFVVGCDGVHSTVRRLAGIPFDGITYPERYAVADVDLTWPLANNEVHLFMTPDGFFNAVALPGGPHRGRVLCDLPRGAPKEPTLDLVQGLFDRRTGGLGRMESPTFLQSFRIHRRLARTFGRGPVLLAGDAAHACSPLLGQGMNLGIQDAFNLAWKLALACRGEARPALLASYDAERRPVARKTLMETDFVHRVSRVGPAWLRRVRDAAVSVLSKLEISRNHAAMTCSALGVAYRTSPLVGARHASQPLQLPTSLFEQVESHLRRPGSPAPGERAPDLALRRASGDPLSLLPREAGRHSALLFLGSSPVHAMRDLLADLARRARTWGEAVEVRAVTLGSAAVDLDGVQLVHDTEGLAHEAYAVSRPTLFVIRPDAYVAAASAPPDPAILTRSLARVLGGGGLS
ncbi:MAG: FAD-dependent oxidoreductase [Polyangiaceae bacterium]